MSEAELEEHGQIEEDRRIDGDLRADPLGLRLESHVAHVQMLPNSNFIVGVVAREQY